MDAIKICNMAIDTVGGSPILSFADESIEAEQCNLYYDLARRFCLESRDWTFAAKTIQLAQDATAVSSEFAYSFTLPADHLVVRIVSSNAKLDVPTTYQKNGNQIITDSGTLYIKYTRDEETASRFSPAFTAALAHKLAEYLAPKITGDMRLKGALMQESDSLLESGGSVDGMQGSPKRAYASKLLRARNRGVNHYGLGNYV